MTVVKNMPGNTITKDNSKQYKTSINNGETVNQDDYSNVYKVSAALFLDQTINVVIKTIFSILEKIVYKYFNTKTFS